MSYSKIKKHFSLFMVKKSIKKKKNEPDSNSLIEENEIDQFNHKKVQKYIDPITCYHLYGDIFFFDKLNELDIGLLSTSNMFKMISGVKYFEDYDMWMTNLTTMNYELDSWNFVYERLMSLGDKQAYELAQTLNTVFISNIKQYEDDNLVEFDHGEKYQYFLKELADLFKLKKNSLYFCVNFELKSRKKGLELKKSGISKKMIDLVYGEDSVFLQYLLNFGFYDFLTVDKENYFDFIKNNILSVNAEDRAMMLKFHTIDGHWIYMTPRPTTKFFINESGDISELMLLYEFFPKDNFIKYVNDKRENKTKIRNKKSNREKDLENALHLYYPNEDFNRNKKKLNENKMETEDIDAIKRCGYAPISKTKQEPFID